MKKLILITGVAGLLGSRLADWIIENTDNKVIGIDIKIRSVNKKKIVNSGFYKNIDLYETSSTNEKIIHLRGCFSKYVLNSIEIMYN